MKKNKNIIIGILATVLIFGGLVWLAGPSSPISQGEVLSSEVGVGKISVSEDSFDFGKISMAAGKVSRSFAIKNESEGSLTISKMYTSCMCTTATLISSGKRIGPLGMPGHGFIPPVNKEIGPGEEVSVEVVFDPAAHGPAGIGRVERLVYLENSTGKTVELKIAASVIP
jgi:hypothetical protein